MEGFIPREKRANHTLADVSSAPQLRRNSRFAVILTNRVNGNPQRTIITDHTLSFDPEAYAHQIARELLEVFGEENAHTIVVELSPL